MKFIVKVKSFDPVQHFQTTPELVDQPWNRLKKEKLEKMELSAPTAEEQDVCLFMENQHVI